MITYDSIPEREQRFEFTENLEDPFQGHGPSQKETKPAQAYADQSIPGDKTTSQIAAQLLRTLDRSGLHDFSEASGSISQIRHQMTRASQKAARSLSRSLAQGKMTLVRDPKLGTKKALLSAEVINSITKGEIDKIEAANRERVDAPEALEDKLDELAEKYPITVQRLEETNMSQGEKL